MSERAPTGIGAMEAAADVRADYHKALQAMEIDQAHGAASLENAAIDKANAIEARIVSPEVSALNDIAELEIYGSRGRTYTDPETGAVIADAAHPIAGKVEDMLHSPKYGKTAAERKAASDKYAADVQAFLGDGFELCQAKLVLDLREGDKDSAGAISGKWIAEGMNPLAATRKAKDLYIKKDAERQRLIKEGGAFTADEYKRIRDGEDIYAPADPTAPTPDAIDRAPVEPDGSELQTDPELQAFETRLNAARDAFAKISAERRGRLATFGGSKRQKAFDKAEKDYDLALKAYGVVFAQKSFDLGVRPDKTAELITAGFVDEHLAVTTREWKQITTEKPLGKILNWYRNSSTSKRILAGAGLGVAAGAVGLAVGTGAAAAVGLVGATRFARGFLRSNAKNYGDNGLADNQSIIDKGDQIGTQDITGTIKERIAEDQNTMRKAVAAGVGGVALGSVLGFAFRHSGDAIDWVKDRLPDFDWPFGDDPKVPKPETPTSEPPVTPPEAPKLPDGPTVSSEMNITRGGLENAFQDAHNLTDAEARQVYEAAAPFLRGVAGTYLEGDDIRISRPGAFQMPPEAQQAATDALRKVLSLRS